MELPTGVSNVNKSYTWLIMKVEQTFKNLEKKKQKTRPLYVNWNEKAARCWSDEPTQLFLNTLYTQSRYLKSYLTFKVALGNYDHYPSLKLTLIKCFTRKAEIVKICIGSTGSWSWKAMQGLALINKQLKIPKNSAPKQSNEQKYKRVGSTTQSKQAHPHTPLTLIPTETYWIAGKLMAIYRIPP